jgi:hypothetical protein
VVLTDDVSNVKPSSIGGRMIMLLFHSTKLPNPTMMSPIASYSSPALGAGGIHNEPRLDQRNGDVSHTCACALNALNLSTSVICIRFSYSHISACIDCWRIIAG